MRCCTREGWNGREIMWLLVLGWGGIVRAGEDVVAGFGFVRYGVGGWECGCMC